MDYEKKYKKALERMKIWVSDDTPDEFFDTHEVHTFVFPELAVSEDERVRKGLITAVSATLKGNKLYGTDVTREEALAWLEKQGTSYTKKDVDDAYLKGISDAKNELEKQGEKKSSDEVLKIRQELYQSGYNDGYKHGCEDTKKQGEQKQKQYDIDVLEKHITKDSISELAHTVIVRNGWEIVNAKEQKHAWSEEDRTMAFTLMRDVDQMSYISKEGKNERIGWLNSLDEKFASTESAWSEEDEVKLQACIDCLQAESLMGKVDTVMTNWLKSLKDRYIWKPSDEQIVVLELASKYERVFTPKQIDVLIGLKEQLKKIKGE